MVDLDGVLADFVAGYNGLALAASGKHLGPARSWNWATEAGLSVEQDAAIWAEIHKDPEFWFRLEPLPGARDAVKALNEADSRLDVYFCTQRPHGAKFWTEQWLGELGMETPTVLLAGQKGKVASALKVTHAIDDKPEHCLDVFRALPPEEAEVTLLAQPWNEWAQVEWDRPSVSGGVRVVRTVSEWIERVVRGVREGVGR